MQFLLILRGKMTSKENNMLVNIQLKDINLLNRSVYVSHKIGLTHDECMLLEEITQAKENFCPSTVVTLKPFETDAFVSLKQKTSDLYDADMRLKFL